MVVLFDQSFVEESLGCEYYDPQLVGDDDDDSRRRRLSGMMGKASLFL